MNGVPVWAPVSAMGTGGSAVVVGLLQPSIPVVVVGASVTVAALIVTGLNLWIEKSRIEANRTIKAQIVDKAGDVENLGTVLLAVEGLSPVSAPRAPEAPAELRVVSRLLPRARHASETSAETNPIDLRAR